MNKNRSKTYVQPGENDVKPNGGNHSHPGNRRYVKMIEKRKVQFVLADTKGKNAIILDIYNSILPGRFLQKEKGTNKYIVKDKVVCLAKIRKALSENNNAIIKALELRGKWPKKPRPPVHRPTISASGNDLNLTRKDWLKLAQCFK